MGEVINFESRTKTNSHQPITDDETRLFSIYDVAIGLIIDIEEGKTFSMTQLKEQMIEVIEIIQEEL
ncbi:hypothetical protein G9F31_12510 [Acinetobacter sp. 187]|uniref:hypothetical protein n=1 Tax=Acinetobacter lanii TaxID=2715163 RepID=UPI00140BCAFB|nr:hypothetical protein [Acinetobacter lanii]NHC04577.1 hypothetical protein [Acinetobacter lanii]